MKNEDRIKLLSYINYLSDCIMYSDFSNFNKNLKELNKFWKQLDEK